ncbi:MULTISPECIES: amidohydrolase family protein [Thermomonosporaceae]|uniref:amidohydrolase family protein n=1 Tax=Thermomonosporaceae TaxID=2012 RepID=UPI00255B15E1|nr:MULTISPECIES: amidohydrolase family protein [Thermomonosporaceae]MDL4775404.1 amidohydrolase family protein [Actinomadura xylanilytica]
MTDGDTTEGGAVEGGAVDGGDAWRGRVIDAHGHLGSWFNFAIPDPSTAGLLSVMDRAGVATMCVSHLLGVGPDARAGNALLLAELARRPGRLLGYAVYDPHDRQAPARLAELLDEPAVIGVKLHPDTHQYPLDGPAYAPAFALAADRGRLVLSHGEHGSAWSDPERFATVAARHPGVPLLMGHAGLWPAGFDAAARVADRCPNVVLEICGSRMTARHLARLVATAGADRMVFGSDALFLDLRVGLGRVVLAPIAPADRDLLLFGTMTRLLKGTR